MFQQPFELGPRCKEPPGNRCFRTAQGLGGFGMRQSVVHRQDDRGPLFRLELQQRLLDLARMSTLVTDRFENVLRYFSLQLLPALAAFAPIEAEIYRNPVEPRREPRLGSKARELLIRSNERLLCQIIGIRQ